ncbi:MAG: serine--tRNA ligase [Candidatus Omnitrophota bacterium]
MLDMKFIRDNQERVKKMLKDRNVNIDLDELLKVDEERRKLITEVEQLKNQRNRVSEEIGRSKAKKVDANDKILEMKSVSQKIKEIDVKVDELEQKMANLLYQIPNMPHNAVPIGSAKENKVVKEWGSKKPFDFKPVTHLELAESLDIIDLERAAKITGSNFVLFKGEGARLERALINFMLDLHTKKHGYTEISPPFLVNRESMTGTGQLPNLEADMYKLKDDDLFLIPTAEVPVTNIFAKEILPEQSLPIYYTAYTPCFRREAGSYGKDTKGLIRIHQFDKVEMVKFVKPETSYDELEKLLANAEEVLQLLELSYRVLILSTQDMSFAAAKCYDIEAWSPGAEMYLEVSSCSNFEDFQARRAGIRFKRTTGKGTGFVHTLNGSGVALARTVIALMETYQQPDGSIIVPNALRPYMDGQVEIIPK